MDEYGNFIACDIICSMFDLSIMQYNAIVTAIPMEWRKTLRETKGFLQPVQSNFEKICERSHLTSYFYHKMNRCTQKIDALNLIWKGFINKPVINVRKQFTRIYMITNHSKLRSFQYRIIHNALIFNKRLKLWKIKNSDLCTNCEIYAEDILHFFYECKFAEQLWVEVFEMIKTKYDVYEIGEYLPTNILFSELHDNPTHLVNFICLVVKMEMYKARCTGVKCNIHCIYTTIEKFRIYELYNAKKNNNVKKYRLKWEPNKEERNNVETVALNKYIEEYLADLIE